MRILAVTNIYPSVTNPSSGIYVKEQLESLKKLGLAVEVLHIERDRRGMASYLSFPRILRQRVRSFQPDLIHVMYGGVTAYLTSRSTKLPLVITFHGSDLLGEPYAPITRRLAASVGVVCSRYAAQSANWIIVVSEQLRHVLPDAIDRSRVAVIPCGVDLSLFRPMDRAKCRTKLGWSGRPFHVLFPAGGKNLVKRPQLAIAAVEELRRRDVPVRLHFLEGVERNEVPVTINAADVVLITSWHEGSPMIVKEALACNTPVVSVEVGDVAERIRGLEGCYLTSTALTDIVQKLLRVYREGVRLDGGRGQVTSLSLSKVACQIRDFYLKRLAHLSETDTLVVPEIRSIYAGERRS